MAQHEQHLKSARRGVSRLCVVLIFSMMFQVVYPIAREVILAAGFPNFGIQSKFGFDGIVNLPSQGLCESDTDKESPPKKNARASQPGCQGQHAYNRQEQDDWNASPGSHEEVLRPSPAGERPLQILANPITVDASRGVPTKTWILLHAVVTGVGGFENGAAKDIIGAREHWLQALAPESSCAYDANVAGRKLNPAHLEDVHSHAPRDRTARHELVWMYRHVPSNSSRLRHFPGFLPRQWISRSGRPDLQPQMTTQAAQIHHSFAIPIPPLPWNRRQRVQKVPVAQHDYATTTVTKWYRAGSEIVAARAGETETGAPVDSSLINGEILDELGEEEGAHGGRPQTRGEGSKARLASKEATVQDAPRRHRDIFADEKISGSRRASNARPSILSPLSRRRHAELASTQNVDFHRKWGVGADGMISVLQEGCRTTDLFAQGRRSRKYWPRILDRFVAQISPPQLRVALLTRPTKYPAAATWSDGRCQESLETNPALDPLVPMLSRTIPRAKERDPSENRSSVLLAASAPRIPENENLGATPRTAPPTDFEPQAGREQAERQGYKQHGLSQSGAHQTSDKGWPHLVVDKHGGLTTPHPTSRGRTGGGEGD
ncbi:hypothetical protein DFH06DRAFT_1131929 [Mycena polygramma]|nr:hypothetical protein DFH06DRAFT_1131929 [Mycena polygramma]